MSEKRIQRDLRPTIEPLEGLIQENQKLIQRAERELGDISDSFKGMIEGVIKERPDTIVFLDKGARLFAAPISRYLREVCPDYKPELSFYNDENMKDAYSKNLENEVLDAPFKEYQGKKVLFVDETIYSGLGAVAVLNACERVGIDAKYCALSDASSGSLMVGVSIRGWEKFPSDHLERADQLIEQRKIETFPNYKGDLFSKDASGLYVAQREEPVELDPRKISTKAYLYFDSVGRTETKTCPRFVTITEDEADQHYDYSAGGHLRTDENPPGVGWQEYEQQVVAQNRETIRKLQDMIYKTIKN